MQKLAAATSELGIWRVTWKFVMAQSCCGSPDFGWSSLFCDCTTACFSSQTKELLVILKQFWFYICYRIFFGVYLWLYDGLILLLIGKKLNTVPFIGKSIEWRYYLCFLQFNFFFSSYYKSDRLYPVWFSFLPVLCDFMLMLDDLSDHSGI